MKWFVFKHEKAKASDKVTILPLTPRDDAKGLEAYIKRLDVAFAEPSIKNIAVTGKFGAGKSTVLRTYFKNKKVLWVTLAPFIEYAYSLARNNNKKFSDKLGRVLEISILKQMFYTSSQRDLPFSRFSRIVHNTLFHYIGAVFVVISLLCTILFIWQPESIWSHFGLKDIGDRTNLARTAFFFAIFPVTMVVMAVYDEFRKHMFHGKLSAACAEVELGANDSNMSFSRTIDEIIYHFQRLQYDAVVFEDVDRFPGTIIFSKLKEMNHIINESKDVPKRFKPVRFVYALRDLVLKDEERVKFFDFILPIVPITSIANSQEHFRESLKRCIGVDKLDSRYVELIKSVSQYIVDLRLINNICNEFSVYKEALGPDVSASNLLGITIFKNVLPNEYECLLRGKGVVVDCLALAEEKISDKMSTLDEKLTTLKSQLNDNPDNPEVSSQLKKSIDEIRNEKIQWGKLNLKKLLRAKRIESVEIEKIMAGDSKKEVDQKDVNKKADNKKENDIAGCGEREKRSLDYRQKRILFALLLGGYIDENFRHYLSAFKAEIVSARDHKFVLSVVRNSRLDFDYSLDSIDSIVAGLDTWLFEREAALNYFMAHSALIGSSWPEDKRDVFLSYLFENDALQISFIDSMLQYYSDKDELYEALVEKLAAFHIPYLVNLIDEKTIAADRKLCQIGLFLKTQSDLTKVSLSSKVLDYLLSFTDLASLFKRMHFTIDDVSKFLSSGRIAFQTIDFTSKDDLAKQVIEKVIETDSYVISRDNLRGLMNMIGQDTSKWNSSAGSIIYGCGNKSMLRRLDFDLLTFIEHCCFDADESQNDDARFIEYVLNHPIMNKDIAEKFLGKQIVGIIDAHSIRKNEYIEYAISVGKLKPSWENVTEYYRRFIEKSDIAPEAGFEDSSRPYREKLLLYLKQNRTWFENHPYDVDYEYDYLVISIVVGAKSLHDTFVKRIVDGCGTLKARLWIEENMPTNRLHWLKEKALVKFDVDAAKRLRNSNKNIFAAYVALFIDKALDCWKELDIKDDEIVLILKTGYVTAKHVASIAKKLEGNDKIADDLASAIAPYISIRNLQLFSDVIVCYCFGKLSPVALQCHVITEYKFDKENTEIALKLMPRPYADLSNNGVTVELPRSEVVAKFLLRLRERSIVKSFRKHDNMYRVCTVVPEAEDIPF